MNILGHSRLLIIYVMHCVFVSSVHSSNDNSKRQQHQRTSQAKYPSTAFIKMSVKRDIVLVTGSSGCLGEHIVKVLQTCDSLRELRLYDRRPYYNKLGIPDWARRTEIMADINYPKLLHHALKDVDCVIHCSAVVDTRIVPENDSMWLNNVEGTKSIIDGCLKKNVPCLIFASTTAVCGGNEDIFFQYECNVRKPSKFVLKTYAKTKSIAEDLVIEANGKLCEDGLTILKTVVLRPTTFYGEGDVHFIPTLLRLTSKCRGTHHKFNTGDSRLQLSYVGNVAWAFFKAKQSLAEDDIIAGEIFFITDDSYPYEIHRSLRPFIWARRFRVRKYPLPFYLVWFVFAAITYFVRFINLFWKVEVDLPSVEQFNYLFSTFIFNRVKAHVAFDYYPIYTYEESLKRSNEYYANMRLE